MNISQKASKPGDFVLPLLETFGLWVYLVFAAAILVLCSRPWVLGWDSVSVTFSFATVLHVIANGENPRVCAVKYRYLSSSFERLVGSWFHVLSLYLFRVMEDLSIFLSGSVAKNHDIEAQI